MPDPEDLDASSTSAQPPTIINGAMNQRKRHRPREDLLSGKCASDALMTTLAAGRQRQLEEEETHAISL